MPIIQGARTNVGYALLALFIGGMTYIGILYAPTWANTSLIQGGQRAVFPEVPQNATNSWIAGAIAFTVILVFILWTGRTQKTGQIPSGAQ